MSNVYAIFIAVLPFFLGAASGQETPAPSAKPNQHVLGTITATNPVSHSLTVKEDKTGTEYAISLEKTRTLLKVEPGAKDLKSAVRITATDFAAGDRVDIRGYTSETGPSSISAASVILMSARELQQARQAELADWHRRGTVGIVTAVDPAGASLTIRMRGAQGPQPASIETTAATQFMRYSYDDPNVALPSRFSEIQPGDEVRVLGSKIQDGSSITAEKLYSGSFRTIAGTVAATSTDGKHMTVIDLQKKQPIEVEMTAHVDFRKLSPETAAMLARRFNPGVRNTTERTAANADIGAHSSGPAMGAKAGEQGGADMHRPSDGSTPAAPSGGMTDLSKILERQPTITLSDLKPGDAVVVSGAQSPDKSRVTATSIIAGVEPILQSAPARQGRSLAEDWNLDMAIPAQ